MPDRPPRTMYEVTADRLRHHLSRDAELFEEGDQTDIQHVIFLLECAQRARALGCSIATAAFSLRLPGDTNA